MPSIRNRTKLRALTCLAAAGLSGVALLGFGVTPASAATGADIVNIANANLGKGYCSTNSAGGKGFNNSCTANNGTGELWCGDFVSWVWQQAGVPVPATNPAYVPSWINTSAYHPLSSGYVPQPGDAVVFGNDKYPTQGSHISIATDYSNGLLSDIGGDEGGGGNPWWSTSTVKVDEGSGSAWNPHNKLFAGTGDEMWVLGYVSSGASALNLSSQVTAIGKDGLLYHEVRDANGTLSGFQPVGGYQGATRFAARSVAVAGMPGGSAQLVAVGNDGNAYHNIRYANGTWQGWGPLNFAASQVAIAAMPDRSAQVLAMAPDGTLYHNIRFTPSGSWQGFRALLGYAGGSTFQARAAAITGLPDGSAQLVAVGFDGNAYHNIRHANGTWQGWSPLGVAASSVAAAGMPTGGSAQFVIVGSGGTVFHNIRKADGTWQGWRSLGFTATRVAIAAIGDGSAQVLAEAPDGTVYHNIRYSPSGAWQGFRALAGYEGAATFQGSAISIGGFPY